MFRSFSGGVQLAENKKLTKDVPFSNLSIPQTCWIPLHQHSGKPALPVVQVDEIVKEGQLIGKADGQLSTNIHSSIPGKVKAISEYPTAHLNNTLCVVIETEGRFSTSGRERNVNNWRALSPADMLAAIADAGIVGLSGTGFPTSVKLYPVKEKKIDTLIVNAAECEPYMTSDNMLLRTYPAELTEGIEIAMKIIGAEKAFIGTCDNIETIMAPYKKDSIRYMKLNRKYPAGAEKQIVYSLTGKRIPAGANTTDLGVVVLNAGTVFAIREAVIFNKPLFERYISVTGNIVNKPGNYKVRIGTRISDIIEECGGLKEQPAKIIMGGPMRGVALTSLDVPVVKGTTGLLFLSKDEIFDDKSVQCIRCGRCVSVCPAGLMPCNLGNAIEKEQFDLTKTLNLFDCIMCGSCSYICPARRPLSRLIKTAREKLQNKKSA